MSTKVYNSLEEYIATKAFTSNTQTGKGSFSEDLNKRDDITAETTSIQVDVDA